MAETALTVRLVGSEGDGGLVRFDDFTIFCRTLSKCLRRVEEIVRPDGDRLRYRIVAMGASSAAVTLEAIRPPAGRDERAAVIGLFCDTASRLEAGKRRTRGSPSTTWRRSANSCRPWTGMPRRYG